MKQTYLLIACAALVLGLSACEEKKSLDGHSMEKPPPSAFMERDSVPVFDDDPVEEESAGEEQN